MGFSLFTLLLIMQTAFIQSEILLALEGAAELDVLYQNYRMATAITTSLEHHILY